MIRKSPNKWRELPDAPHVTVSLIPCLAAATKAVTSVCNTQRHISHDKSLHLMPQNFIKRKRNQALLMYVCPAALFVPHFTPLHLPI